MFTYDDVLDQSGAVPTEDMAGAKLKDVAAGSDPDDVLTVKQGNTYSEGGVDYLLSSTKTFPGTITGGIATFDLTLGTGVAMFLAHVFARTAVIKISNPTAASQYIPGDVTVSSDRKTATASVSKAGLVNLLSGLIGLNPVPNGTTVYLVIMGN